MGRILDTVEEWLVSESWKFEQLQDSNIIKTGVKGEQASYKIFFDAKEQSDILLVYFICPIEVPKNARLSVADFLTRANFGLWTGNFELNMDDGHLRYKVSVDVEDGQLSTTMVKNMFLAGINLMDRYFPGLMAICYAGKSPVDAISQCEIRPESVQ